MILAFLAYVVGIVVLTTQVEGVSDEFAHSDASTSPSVNSEYANAKRIQSECRYSESPIPHRNLHNRVHDASESVELADSDSLDPVYSVDESPHEDMSTSRQDSDRSKIEADQLEHQKDKN